MTVDKGCASDFDLTQLFDAGKSLNEGAITIPGYSMEGWYGRIFRGCGFFDPDKPIAKFTKRELHDLLHKEATKIKVDGINPSYAGSTLTGQHRRHWTAWQTSSRSCPVWTPSSGKRQADTCRPLAADARIRRPAPAR